VGAAIKQHKGATAPPAPAGARRGVGRPRNEQRGEEILSVTLRLLSERGYAGLTIDEVIAGARVSKTTLYRRWPTKEQLVMAAFELVPQLKVRDRGSLMAELLEFVARYDRNMHQTPLGSVLPGLISEGMHNSVLAAQLRKMFERRSKPSLAIITRAIARGDLPAGTDPEYATELFMAPVMQRAMFAHDRMNVQEFQKIFETILAGIHVMQGATPPVTGRVRSKRSGSNQD